MPPRIWQPEHPTPGWLQAEKDSDLTVYLPVDEGVVIPVFFRLIPAGQFRMGSREYDPREEPVHLVKIPKDFYLGTFPVTQAQYRVMARECLDKLQTVEGNKGIDPSELNGDLRPVENVSWHEANEIGQWLFGSGLLPIGWQVGLPSEAMWEYACRGGTETDYWNGDGEATLAEVGWYAGNSGNKTHPVGELPANRWGLHDMHGNVLEWCADVWDEKAYRKRCDVSMGEAWSVSDAGDDAEYWMSNDPVRLQRGGSWEDAAKICHSACRDFLKPDYRYWSVGFRLCIFHRNGDSMKAQEAHTGAMPADRATPLNLNRHKLPPLGDGDDFQKI